MEKIEKKKLRKEYDDFTKNNPRGILLLRYLYYSIIASLIVFLLPKDILTQYPIFRYFTDFMKNIFPNIEIFAQRSKMPELTEFYFSYMWIVSITMVILFLVNIPKLNDEVKKYFGTGEYKNKGILPLKYLIFYSKEALFTAIALFILMLFTLYINYTGSVIDYGVSKLRFNEIINTRFGMFFISNVFQSFVNLALVGIAVDSILLTINKIKLKKGE